MARYIMANRRAGMFVDAEKIAARRSVGVALDAMAAGVDIVNDAQPDDPTARRIVVFDADPGEVAAMTPQLSRDVIIEPEILHWPESVPPRDLLRAVARTLAGPVPAGAGATLNVLVQGSGAPLEGAQVILYLRALGTSTNITLITPSSGQVVFSFGSFWSPAALVVVPHGNFWPMVIRGPASSVVVDCPALPADGPTQWWHDVLGVDSSLPERGSGIRVGVADTGVGPHPCLDHVTDIGAFINGAHLPQDGADVDSHGSHVNGIIGAIPVSAGQFAGIAPGASLFSARVFPPNDGANQGDIVNAIERLSRDHEVDLINLSLGASLPSSIEQDAIQDALERGTLCVCAAANSAGPVEYPAAFPQTVAVSAIGQLGWGPAGSLASLRVPEAADRFGNDNLYLASFSCFGPEITCAAPGVGIISTVPERYGLAAPYAAMGGTSMASPAACAALAVLLADSSPYSGMPRDITRAQTARSILTQSCLDIGLAADYQGRGLPQLS